MTRFTTLKLFTLVMVVVINTILFAPAVRGQGKQAVIVLKSTGEKSTSPCEGLADLNYQLVTNVKINGKDEVRLLNESAQSGSSTLISRKSYESSPKAKLQNLLKLGWQKDGLLYASSVAGQTAMLAIPDDMKPQKNADQTLQSFYSVMISGEIKDGKQKRQFNLQLKDVSKIFFIAEGASVNDVLFKHAVEEESVTIWEAYLKTSNNHRSKEANAFVRDALIVCAKGDVESFNQGNYGSLQKARQKAQRAQSVKQDEQSERLLLSINQAEERVNKLRGQVELLIREAKWDEAIDAAEPIKIYLTTWPELDSMYKHSLKQSHEIHLFKGQEALQAQQLETARDNCSTAWQRLPESQPARTCVCESRNRITLRDSKRQREQKRPKEAKALLEKQLEDADCSKDSRVVASLKETNCEYADQLFEDAKRLLGVATTTRTASPSVPINRRGKGKISEPVREPVAAKVKPISGQNKNDFRQARSMLVLANQLCEKQQLRDLLESANRSLADYCMIEARKALQRGHDGTAYVYLQAAQEYTPGNGNVSSLMSEARDRFAQKTRVNIGAAFRDTSGNRYGTSLVNQVSSEVESGAANTGLTRAIILDREQAANAARAIQANRALAGPTVIFFGELLNSSVRADRLPRTVPATYQYYNPQREREDRAIDEVKKNQSNCRKQNGEPACRQYDDELARMRAHRDSLPRYLTDSYTYSETTFRIQGTMKMSFRSMNSISRIPGAAQTLEASINQECTQREGMRDSGGNYRNDPPCNIQPEETYISQMAAKIISDARSLASSELITLPRSYYLSARTATNRQESIEDYLRFLFLTRDKNGTDARGATEFLLSIDPELKTDGILH